MQVREEEWKEVYKRSEGRAGGWGGREGTVSFSHLSLKYAVEFFDHRRLLIGRPSTCPLEWKATSVALVSDMGDPGGQEQREESGSWGAGPELPRC